MDATWFAGQLSHGRRTTHKVHGCSSWKNESTAQTVSQALSLNPRLARTWLAPSTATRTARAVAAGPTAVLPWLKRRVPRCWRCAARRPTSTNASSHLALQVMAGWYSVRLECFSTSVPLLYCMLIVRHLMQAQPTAWLCSDEAVGVPECAPLSCSVQRTQEPQLAPEKREHRFMRICWRLMLPLWMNRRAEAGVGGLSLGTRQLVCLHAGQPQQCGRHARGSPGGGRDGAGRRAPHDCRWPRTSSLCLSSHASFVHGPLPAFAVEWCRSRLCRTIEQRKPILEFGGWISRLYWGCERLGGRICNTTSTLLVSASDTVSGLLACQRGISPVDLNACRRRRAAA